MCSLAFNIPAKHLHLNGDIFDRGALVEMLNLARCLWPEVGACSASRHRLIARKPPLEGVGG